MSTGRRIPLRLASITWLQRYRLRHFLRFSFWSVPVGWLGAALLVVRAVRWLDQQTSWTWFDYTAEGARAVLSGLSTSTLTFIVFAVSALLVAVQLASSQLTPRIIAFVFTRRLVQVSVGVFVFAYTFALAALGRIEEPHVLQLLVCLAVLSNLISMVLFFWFVQQVGTSLRPVAILQSLEAAGRRVIDSVYPSALEPTPPPDPPLAPVGLPAPSRTIAHIGTSGTFLAFGVQALVAAAQQAECVIELLPQVGDFVAHGEPLFRIAPVDRHVAESDLHQMVAFGPERTLEQDPAFAFRIMVDIAARALSAAINDPTTAVLALDQLHSLLHYVGQKQLDPGRVCDGHGQLRLLYPTPQWEDFVALAVIEIRLFGTGSLQIPRRLRAMLEQLIAVLPAARTPVLQQELALLHSAVARAYPEVADRQRAETSDRQGIGGAAQQRTQS
jgi:uncharacterized membrane protein